MARTSTGTWRKCPERGCGHLIPESAPRGTLCELDAANRAADDFLEWADPTYDHIAIARADFDR